MKIVYEQDGILIAETFTQGVIIDFPHIVVTNDITEPMSSWYIEDNQIKIDQQKLIQHQRQQMTALSKRQFNLVMYDNELLTQVKELLSQNERTQIEFDSTDTITRLHPTVIQLAKDLGLTEERVDELWAEALTIN